MKMNVFEKVRMLQWWIRQQEHNRKDLYVLRLDQSGNVIGKSLKNPLANPLFGKGEWQLINDKTEENIDWGYLWFDFQEPTLLEKITGYRNLTVYTSNLRVGRVVGPNYFLYIAVSSAGWFGNFSTPMWTSWKS